MPIIPSARAVWGLDIASSAIKAVRLRIDDNRVRILAADMLPIEGEPVSPDAAGRDKRIWQGLQSFEAKYNISRERVIIGLPGSLFFNRPFSLFLVGNRTEHELVQFEMEQHIPFGLDAVVWDYEVFEPEDITVRERQGLLFAMKKESLNSYLLSLSSAHIEPAQIQAAPLALYNFVRHELAYEGTTLVIDLGASSTSLLAMSDKRYWTRTLNIGGGMITSAIQKASTRALTHTEAGKIKMSMSRLSVRGELMAQVEPAMRRYAAEIRNAAQHLGQEHGLAFDRAVLLGGGANTYGMSHLLQESLRVRTVTPAGLSRIELGEGANADYVRENLPALATAIGLGLQGVGRAATRVNMVTATLAQRHRETSIRRSAIYATISAAVLVVLWCLFCYWRFSIYDSALNGADAQNLRLVLAPVNVRWMEMKKLKTEGQAEQTMEKFAQMARERAVWIRVMHKVALILPDNAKRTVPASEKIWLLRLTVGEKSNEPGVYECEMEAGCQAQKDVVAFVTRALRVPLADDPLFQNVSGIEDTMTSSTLSFAGPPGDSYYLLRLRFEAVPAKAGRP